MHRPALPEGRETALPEGREKVRRVDAMFDRIAPRYELVNRLMTFGLDARWRRQAVAALRLPPGSVVADVASGTGDLCRVLDDAGHRPLGIERSPGMLAEARAPGPQVRGDALALPVATAALDGVTCGFGLRNFSAVGPFLDEAARALRPGGRLAILEVDRPDHPVLRAGHRLHFEVVAPRIGALLSDRHAYRYLPRSVAYLPERAALLAAIAAGGFAEVTHERLGLGAVQLITATRA